MLQVDFVLKNQDQATRLPFKILVLANFSLKKEQLKAEFDSLDVSLENLDQVLATFNLSLNLELENHLFSQPENVVCSFEIRKMEDFHPQNLLSNIPDVKCLLEARQFLTSLLGQQPNAIPPKILPALHRLGFKGASIKAQQAQFLAAQIDDNINQQIDAVIHHKDFQALESVWRGLYNLAQATAENANSSLTIVDVDQQQLTDNFQETNSIEDTALYQKVYIEEYGQYGGNPYSIMVSDLSFGHSLNDIFLLKSCAQVAEAAKTPFLANVSPQLFAVDDWSEVSALGNLAQILDEGVQYRKWQSMRQEKYARFVGLTLPPLLLRQRYDFRQQPISGLAYVESDQYLWGASSFGLAICLMRSHQLFGWCIENSGPIHGAVHILDLDQTDLNNQHKAPVQSTFSESEANELKEAGFLPLVVSKQESSAFFNADVTLKKRDFRTGQDNQIDQLECQLSYTLVLCRLIHYLKAIQRSYIGTTKTALELERELNQWLSQYVANMENPSFEVRTRRPFKLALVKVQEDQGMAGQLGLNLRIIPHLKYMGAEFSLQMDSRLEQLI